MANQIIIIKIAMGEHTSSTNYKLTDYGQPDGDFEEGKTIAL